MSEKDLAKVASIKNIKRYESKEPPKIEYPCDYPIKVLGDSGIDLYTLVMTVMESYSPGFNKSKTTIKDSKNGTYQAITVTITATSAEQIQSLFDDLKVNPLVKIVL
tara:strand:- start:331 stop:651 length:321 start_codon:yes stop_codon:yes gene_type:complete